MNDTAKVRIIPMLSVNRLTMSASIPPTIVSIVAVARLSAISKNFH
jgi:hypothetical protein